MAVEYTESLDTFLKDTLPQLPGVIREVAERELRLTMREFFERTYAWRATFTDIDAPAGETPILLDSATTGDNNADVVAILRVKYHTDGTATSGHYLSPIGHKPARSLTNSGLPQGYYMSSNPDEFILYPNLDSPQVDGIEVDVALTPKIDATVLPRQVTSKFYDAILDGFLGRMYSHPNKPYSAPALGMQMKHNFRRRMGYYMAQAKAGYNDSQQWSFPRTWGVQRLGGNG